MKTAKRKKPPAVTAKVLARMFERAFAEEMAEYEAMAPHFAEDEGTAEVELPEPEFEAAA